MEQRAPGGPCHPLDDGGVGVRSTESDQGPKTVLLGGFLLLLFFAFLLLPLYVFASLLSLVRDKGHPGGVPNP